MLTPVELQNISLKAGVGGYKKKEVDDLLDEICGDYELLYKENLELKDKLAVLSDGLQYYKEMEKTLQKTLVVAEKTAEEMQTTSQAKANLIKEKAMAEANYIVEDAKKQAQQIHNQTITLVQQYESYRIQYKQLAAALVELMESDAYQPHFNLEKPSFLRDELAEKTESAIKTESVVKKEETASKQDGTITSKILTEKISVMDIIQKDLSAGEKMENNGVMDENDKFDAEQAALAKAVSAAISDAAADSFEFFENEEE